MFNPMLSGLIGKKKSIVGKLSAARFFFFRKIYNLRGQDSALVILIAALALAVAALDVSTGASITLRPLFFAPILLLALLENRKMALVGAVGIAGVAVECFLLSGGFAPYSLFWINFVPTLAAYLMVSELLRYFIFAVQKLHGDVQLLQEMVKELGARGSVNVIPPQP